MEYTEFDIELAVEVAFDRLDREFMRGEINQETYDESARRIEDEAVRRYQLANQ